jgi:hypothetical protein
MTYRITWVLRGTRTASMLGIDEVVTSDDPYEVVLENAVYNAICAGVDVDAHECRVEVIE